MIVRIELHGSAQMQTVNDRLRADVSKARAAGATRIEVWVGVDDHPGRRAALHRAGFRREGRLRAVAPNGNGGADDVYVYGLLATDDQDGDAVFSTVMNTVLPRTRVIGHAVFTDAEGRVLLLHVSYKDEWELPGGVVEPHESPRTGAEREVTEEIGLTVRLGQPLVVDWLPPYLGWDDAVEFIFDGGTLHANLIDSMVLGAGEIRAAHWVRRSDIARHVSPLAARRLEWILDHPGEHTRYFEDGRPT